MIGAQLHPMDTWFFRDGVPFTAAASPQTDVASLFPPYPPTVVGALRAALARGNGWSGDGRWPGAICEVLGDGPHDLGQVSFDGPFLLRDGKPLFRAPSHLMGDSENGAWRPAELLRPGERVTCDLGDVRLPELPPSVEDPATLVTGDKRWLTVAGLNSVLRGEVPTSKEDVIPDDDLWTSEPRVGLERDNATRASKEGMLYSARHIRPCVGVSLGARVSGLPGDWSIPFDQMTPLGGESRLAECESWNGDLGIESPVDAIRQSGSVTVIALTPLDVDRKVYVSEKPIEELGGAQVVSACLGRPQRIGGWDSGPNFGPLPLRSALPPGSALFCEAPDRERLADAISAGNGLARIGARTEMGFGLVALGVWPS